MVYNEEEVNSLMHNLRLNNKLGIKFTSLKFDTKTWNPIINFSWSPPEFLQELFHITSDYKFTFNPLDCEFSGQNVLDVLQKELNKKISKRLSGLAATNIHHFEKRLGISSISKFQFSCIDHAINGSFNYQVKTLEDLCDNTPEFNLKFQINSRKNVNLSYSTNKMEFKECMEDIVYNKLISIKDELDISISTKKWRTTLQDIFEHFTTTPIEIDIHNSQLCTYIKIDLFNDPIEQRICLDYKMSIEDQMSSAIEDFIQLYVKDKLIKYLNANVEQMVNSFGISFPCDQVTRTELFGLIATVEIFSSCTSGTVQFSAYPKKIDITIDPRTRKINFNAKSFSDSLRTEIINKRMQKLFNESQYIEAREVRILQGKLVADLYLDLAKMEVFSLLNLGPINLGNLSIDSNNRIKWNGTDPGNQVKNSILQKVESKANELLSKQLEGQDLSLPSNGLATITSITIDLMTAKFKTLTVNCNLTYKEPIPFFIPLAITFNLDKLQIHDIQPDEDPIALVTRKLAENFLESITTSGCDVGTVSVCLKPFNPKTLIFSGEIKINIADVIKLPGITFTLSPNKFRYDVNPEITLPGPYPISPLPVPLVAIEPTLRFDFDDKKVIGDVIVALGVSEDGSATSKVAKFNFDASFDLKNFNRLDASGYLVVLNAMPIYYGKGYIQFDNTEFDLTQGTTGILEKVIKLKSTLNVNGKEKQMSSLSSLDFLGMHANVGINGLWSEDYFTISGNGRVKIPIVHLTGDIGTTFVFDDPFSHIKYANANIQGSLKIGSIHISKLQLGVSAKFLAVELDALGSTINFYLPSVNHLSKDEILNQIIDLLPILNFEELLKTLPNLINLNLGSIKISFDDLPEDKGSIGEGGNENQTGVLNTSNIQKDGIDSNFKEVINSNVQNYKNRTLKIIKANSKKTINKPVSWRCCKKRHKIGKWCLNYDRCHGTIPYTKEILEIGKWPTVWTCLPEKFYEYYAIIDSVEKHPITSFKVLDLVSPSVGDRIMNDKYKTLLSRASLPKKELMNQRKINLGDGISKTINDDIQFFGNIAYKSNKAYAFISANMPNPSLDHCGSQGNYIKVSETNDIQGKLQCINCIEIITSKNDSLIADNQITILQNPKIFSKKNDYSSLTNENEKLFEILNRNLSDPDTNDEFTIEDLKIARQKYVEDELFDAVRLKTNDLIFLTADNRIIISKKNQSELWKLQSIPNNQQSLNQHYQETSKVWTEINETMLMQSIGRYLPSQHSMTVNNILNYLATLKPEEFSRFRPILEEIISHSIIYGGAGMYQEITNSLYKYSIWDNSNSNPNHYSYTFVEDKDNNPYKLNKWSFKIPVSSLTTHLGIDNLSISDHQTLIDNPRSPYRNLIYYIGQDSTFEKNQLLYVGETDVSFLKKIASHNNDFTYRYKSIEGGEFNSSVSEQKKVIFFRGPLSSNTYSFAALDDTSHYDFFRTLNQMLGQFDQVSAYVMSTSGTNFRSILYSGQEMFLIWENNGHAIAKGPLSFKHFIEGILKRRDNKELDFISNAKEFNNTNNRQIAKLILSAFDSFDYYGKNGMLSLRENLWSEVNPFTFFVLEQ